MKKLFLFSIFLFSVFLLPQNIFAFTSEEITNHQAPEILIYQQEFDKLLFDATLWSGITGQSDMLKAITLQNEGTARSFSEIAKLVLWQDQGKEGFQGMAIDKQLGEFTFYSDNSSWYLKDLNAEVPANGLRIFVSVETMTGAVAYTFFQLKIPALLDYDGDGQYDVGDLGVYFQSKNNGPTDKAVINQAKQSIRRFVVDNLAPKNVVFNPQDNQIIATTTFLVKGKSRDQGGSAPQWVKLALTKQGETDVWQDVLATSDNYLTWQYSWQNITEGTYNLKAKSIDWFTNEGISETVRVVVEFPKEELVSEPEKQKEQTEDLSSVASAKEEQATSTPSIIEQLKTEIARIQQLIIELLKQLIELIKSQITNIGS